MYFARRANDTPARAHVGFQPFNDQEVGEKVYREGKLEAVCGCCVSAYRLNAGIQRQGARTSSSSGNPDNWRRRV
jgi:hypothetical protein